MYIANVILCEAKSTNYFENNYILQSDEGKTDSLRLAERWCISIIYFQLNVLPVIWVSLGQAKPETQLAFHKDGLNVFILLIYPLLVHQGRAASVESYSMLRDLS